MTSLALTHSLVTLTYHAGSDTDRWNPATSSLGQVLVSVQTLFFGEHHFHRGGIPYPGMLTGKITGDEYFEFRIATVRHAMVAVLKQGRAFIQSAEEGVKKSSGGGGDGDEDEDEDDSSNDMTELHLSVVATHFKSCRRRLFQSLKEEIELLTDFPTFFTRLSKEIQNLIEEIQYLDS